MSEESLVKRKSPPVLPKIRRLLRRHQSVKLDLGCGPSKQEGFIGVDARSLPGVDVVHNLEAFPWPFPDGCARVVLMSHFWEHIKPWLTLPFMQELHRVCADAALVMIAGPYAHEFRFVQDPTHCNPSNEATFCYWDNQHPLWHVYRPPVFHLTEFHLVPAPMGRDFNAVLTACKRAQPDGSCPHKTTY